MPPRIEGFRICQSRSAALVTVMKSDPKKTRSTPSMANNRLASGDGVPASADAKSIVPLSMTTRPGRNFRVDGLGVCSVWMNKPTSLSSARGLAAGAAQAGDGTSPPPFDGSDLGTTALGIKPILEQLWKNIMGNMDIVIDIYRDIRLRHRCGRIPRRVHKGRFPQTGGQMVARPQEIASISASLNAPGTMVSGTRS